jgi:hypothetical protein
MIVGKILDNEAVHGYTFVGNGCGGRSVPDVLEKIAIQSEALLVASDDAGCIRGCKVGIRGCGTVGLVGPVCLVSRLDKDGVNSCFFRFFEVLHVANHVGELPDVTIWRTWDVSLTADPCPITEDG